MSKKEDFLVSMPGGVLITGATGSVGPRVVNALYQAGCRIRSFSIHPPRSGTFPQGVEVMIGDVNDREVVQSAMQGMGAVVHLAALLHISNPAPELRERYERINIGGTATVVDAAMKAGVKRVVLASTIAVYGRAEGQVVTEETPAKGDTIYARTKLAAESIVLNARWADGRPVGTVLRLGAVYGSRVKANYERLTHALARRRFIPIGSGLNRRTLIYDKDVGRAAVLAVFHPAAAGRIFNVTDGGFHTLHEIIDSICSALGRRPPRLSLPIHPTRALIDVMEKWSHALGLKPPITREMIDKYSEDVAVEGRRIQAELGFVPQYDLATGWREAVLEMRQAGLL